MGPKSQTLIKRSKIPRIWVTGEFGGNSLVERRESDSSGLRIRRSESEKQFFQKLIWRRRRS